MSLAGVVRDSDGDGLTLAGAAQGTATITVTARDSDGNAVSNAFDLPVEPAADDGAPTVVSPIADFGLRGPPEHREFDLDRCSGTPTARN